MICQICQKNDATIHLTEIVDGQRSEMHICAHCATEQGIAVKSQAPINELLSNLLASQPSDEELLELTEKELACPYCGFTLDKLRKEALLGCPYDYEVFEKVLSPLIKEAQNGQTVHCGKIPSKVPTETKRQSELSNLRQKLENAVQAENYELAAKLRDKIEQIE